MKKYSAILFVLTAVFLSLCCGKKGPLLPPIKKAPKQVEVTEAFQRGGEIILKWKNPSSYIDGSLLDEISRVDIWLYKEQFKHGEIKSIDLKTFAREAALLKSIKSSDFPAFEEAGKEETEVYIYSHRIRPDEQEDTVYFWGVKAADKKGRESDFSNPVSVTSRIAPNPPSGLKAEAAADRVILKWRVPEENTDGSSPSSVKGYHVYRSSEESVFARINHELIKKTSYEDDQILFGKEYQYVVRCSASEAPPYLESENSEPVKIIVKDTIGPEKPKGLILIAAGDQITVTWDTVEAEDLYGYKIWRRKKGEEGFLLMTSEPVKENIFHDFSVREGIEYEYCVSACDKAGNESERSDIKTGRLKGYLL